MNPLADAVYDILRQRVPAKNPEITYGDLCAKLPPAFSNIEPHSELLWAALGDIVRACRAANLPALSAIVINKERRAPGKLYYSVAHPSEADDEAQAMVAWAHELGRVCSTIYPTTL